MIESPVFTSANACILCAPSGSGFCLSSINRTRARRTGLAEKKRTVNFTLTAWLVAPAAKLPSGFVPLPVVAGLFVGEKNISDLSVSVCVWYHGELLSIFSASFWL